MDLPRDSRHGYSSSRGDRDRDGGHRERHRDGEHTSSHRERGGERGGERGERGGDRHDRSDRGERRRRSRSPPYGGRSGGRRGEEDYHSSRDYRDRERERGYGERGERDLIRERRPDRDRLGGSGGPEDDGGRRRDRSDRGDREGAGGGGRSRRDEREMRGMGMSMGQPRKSASPPPKKKEPTPDLTDIVPINERKRRLTMWDIKPPGYEAVTAEQAKLSGMFPLPGAPRQAAMDPSRLQAFINQPPTAAGSTALKPTNSRQSKRLFVSDLPPMITEESLHAFFSALLNSMNITDVGSDAVTAAQLNPTSTFGMLEFRNPSDATLCLAFDGIEFDDTGVKVHIARPKDYIIPQYSESDTIPTVPGEISSSVPDSLNKICISNLPSYLEDNQVIELLKSFGDLKAFVLVKDRDSGEAKGVAFCEFVDPASTEIALEGMKDMALGDKTLKVQRASIGVKQSAAAEMGINAMAMMAGTTSTEMEGGTVLQLLNMVTAEELMDNDEYEEICDDITEECSKYGKVIDMKVPRPSGGSRQSAGIGKIFVRFDAHEAAEKALRALAGRKFADRTVVVSYFSEENYEVSAW